MEHLEDKMNTVIEQSYKQKKTPKSIMLQIIVIISIIILGAAALIGLRILLPGFGGTLIGALLMFAIVYFGYKKILINFNLEYEYTYLDGEIDIDKIASQTIRTHIITINCKNFEQFGIYDNAIKEQLSHRQFDWIINVTSHSENSIYFAIVKHPKKGLTLVLFEPDNRILEDMQKYIRHIKVYKK